LDSISDEIDKYTSVLGTEKNYYVPSISMRGFLTSIEVIKNKSIDIFD
jgi:hypothetical protein